MDLAIFRVGVEGYIINLSLLGQYFRYFLDQNMTATVINNNYTIIQTHLSFEEVWSAI